MREALTTSRLVRFFSDKDSLIFGYKERCGVVKPISTYTHRSPRELFNTGLDHLISLISGGEESTAFPVTMVRGMSLVHGIRLLGIINTANEFRFYIGDLTGHYGNIGEGLSFMSYNQPPQEFLDGLILYEVRNERKHPVNPRTIHHPIFYRNIK